MLESVSRPAKVATLDKDSSTIEIVEALKEQVVNNNHNLFVMQAYITALARKQRRLFYFVLAEAAVLINLYVLVWRMLP